MTLEFTSLTAYYSLTVINHQLWGVLRKQQTEVKRMKRAEGEEKEKNIKEKEEE